MQPRVIAIDWSGRVAQARNYIWIAESSEPNDLVDLASGRDRNEVTQYLIDEAKYKRDLIVAFDFAFSFPQWFLHKLQLKSAAALWEKAECEGENWLRQCPWPFWGRPNRARPDLPDHFRCTERSVPRVGGIRPKSVFQIGGQGAVGTGSVRGLPVLLQLMNAGFSVWPFQKPTPPFILEIWPRLLTGSVNKSRKSDRVQFFAKNFPKLAERWKNLASSSEDSFDAAASVLVMMDNLEDLLSLPSCGELQTQLEGLIWYPGVGT